MIFSYIFVCSELSDFAIFKDVKMPTLKFVFNLALYATYKKIDR